MENLDKLATLKIQISINEKMYQNGDITNKMYSFANKLLLKSLTDAET